MTRTTGTTGVSDDGSSKLYVSDELSDRLDLESLLASEEKPREILYDETSEHLIPAYVSRPVRCSVEAIAGGTTVAFSGSLQSVSMGPEGWSCTVDGTSTEDALSLVAASAGHALDSARLVVHDVELTLSGSVDAYVGFFDDGTARVSLSADSTAAPAKAT